MVSEKATVGRRAYENPASRTWACQDALADIEIHIYEAWTFEKITKDAARHFLVIADICGWDMPWVEEMRDWANG